MQFTTARFAVRSQAASTNMGQAKALKQWHADLKHYTMTHICLQLCVGKSQVLTTHYVLANVYLFNIKLSVGYKDVGLQVNYRRLSTGKKCVGKKF